MLRIRLWIIVCVLSLATTALQAETVYDASLTYGKARFFGDLSDEQSAPIRTLSTRIMQQQDKIVWGLGIQVLSTSTHHTGNDFPYEKNSQLKLLSFFFTPVVCSIGQVFVCAAMGNGTVNVNAAKHRQDYGSWTYQGNLALKVLDSFAVYFGITYVGRVEQQIAERRSEFSFLSMLVGLTYGSTPPSQPKSFD